MAYNFFRIFDLFYTRYALDMEEKKMSCLDELKLFSCIFTGVFLLLFLLNLTSTLVWPFLEPMVS